MILVCVFFIGGHSTWIIPEVFTQVTVVFSGWTTALPHKGLKKKLEWTIIGLNEQQRDIFPLFETDVL